MFAPSIVATFVHVVEDEYILRLCPCGGGVRSKSSNGRHPWVCDCDYGSGETHCSSVFHVVSAGAAGGGGKVYPWCRQPYVHHQSTPLTDDEDGGNSNSSLLNIDSPGTACSSVLLTGTLTSCTPIQDYDRVRINLFQLGEPPQKNNKYGSKRASLCH